VFNFDFVSQVVGRYDLDEVDKEISVNDAMYDEWYWDVGGSAVQVILAAIMSSYVHKVEHVLDLPCGHGRVLRHLVRMFPQARMYACDLDEDGVTYCADRFGAVPVLSEPDLTRVDFGVTFDLIWVGSLFTHVSEEQCVAWLKHLAGFLSPFGIIVATMHGRWSETVNAKAPYIGPDRWNEIMAGYRQRGYGYADYVQDEASQHTPSNYGVSIARPRAMMRLLEQVEGVRIFSYNERAWADHQDVIVYGKPSFDDPWA
jgi:SAM-dependent methyltransferase